MNQPRDLNARTKAQSAEAASGHTASGAGPERSRDSMAYAKSIGYSEQEMASVPEAAAVTHGCGNPTALAELKEGETVLDLGCGGGLDVFLAAQRVGAKGKVIGVDKTRKVIHQARTNARAGKYTNVEFQVADMEKLPFPDASVDVVISNCVINHSTDKRRVFGEAYRVLKPGGRMFVSDLVTTEKLPEDVLRNADQLWTEWLAAASDRREYLNAMETAGFQTLTVLAEGPFPLSEADHALKGRIISIQIQGSKPFGAHTRRTAPNR